MATYGWRKGTSVADGLFAEGHRFTFFQAMRILERLFPDRIPLAEDVEPDKEVVRLTSAVHSQFAAGDVETVSRSEGDGPPAHAKVHFMGLAGPNAPLPASFSELVYDRALRGDTGPRDFLDLFNHRLLSLFYRARKKYRPPLDHRPPHQGRVANTLFALLGLGGPALRHRLQVEDRSLLPTTGLFLGNRSMIGLERLLGQHFGFPVEIEPFLGAWHRLEDHQRTRIGQRGANHALGLETVLGSRVWEQRTAFEVRCGPLDLAQLLRVLPVNRGYGELCDLVSFYVGDELDFRFRFSLRRDEIPALRLGRAGDARLGWSSRLDSEGVDEGLGGGGGIRLGRAGDGRLGWTTFLGRPPKQSPYLTRRRGEHDWFGSPQDAPVDPDGPAPDGILVIAGRVRPVGVPRTAPDPPGSTADPAGNRGDSLRFASRGEAP